MIRVPTRGLEVIPFDVLHYDTRQLIQCYPFAHDTCFAGMLHQPNEIWWYPQAKLACLDGTLYEPHDTVQSWLNQSRTLDIVPCGMGMTVGIASGSYVSCMKIWHRRDELRFPSHNALPWDDLFRLWVRIMPLNRWVMHVQRAVKAWLTRRRLRRDAFTVLYTLLQKQGVDNADCMRVVLHNAL